MTFDKEKEINVWCDGGARNHTTKIGGYGVFIEYGNTKKMFQSGFINTTNNRMELSSVIYGLRKLKPTDKKINVFSDSAYIVNCINDKWYKKWKRDNRWKNSNGKPVENKDLWIKLLELFKKFPNINFIKVKGHSGIFGNEICDMLSTEAIGIVNQTGKAFKTKERLPDFMINYNLKFPIK
ncbi:hypothetical protein B7C51_24635 (plasmid) [Paenibacillus larvae subsp. pulvifaciens]|uniref:ribonuclease H n=1 Tax=Paenibacillus larvae subsp. pulvifaciens TaxID=1477 RepID=A0A1V0V0A4_9BACL|nr:ribonuclease H [Paenibacillus larvae]ARF70803.1 hypothetical protein B7C51_24635 [Paenibacillus larvae subsp. pulvifaciens]